MQQFTEAIDQIFSFLNKENLINFFNYSLQKPWFFTEFSFLLTFGIFLLGYALFFGANRIRKMYLVAFSLFFYYKSSGPFLLLFISQITIDYFLSLLIFKKNGSVKNILRVIAILFSLSFLLYFKYFNFFAGNLNELFKLNISIQDLFLPIGISFYTFQSISYIQDVYSGKIKSITGFSDYFFYMTFFPHLVAGPIVRASDFLFQVNSPLTIDSVVLRESLFRIIIGLIKKLFIADFLAKYADLVFAQPSYFSGIENLLGVYAYTFQIYFDFSGYSDIALGLALILGYRLKENFNSPYLSANIKEFWKKWHMSLSSWLKDYVYIGFGGNQKGKFNTYLFLLLTMLIGGFWHGANWTFIIWGALHGFALVFHRLITDHLPSNENYLGRIMSLILTFHFVAFCWIFFRAGNTSEAFEVIRTIAFKSSYLDFYPFFMARKEFCYLLLLAIAVVFFPSKWKKEGFDLVLKIPLIFWFFILIFSLQLIIQFRDEMVQPFIYFQF